MNRMVETIRFLGRSFSVMHIKRTVSQDEITVDVFFPLLIYFNNSKIHCSKIS